ncbi:hypothetical protein BU24DRAFT_78345 [Aaosphaeria arxii CBS 175.79]|uniref:Uncharacterized protein n=1 Tax=Aaosphaeria arxii CBS 175.79 TaxID=1450172 RepID=A0A6A5X9H8_9PLEO|nr:uncharacterized protein BU24DRAFT_78345 [Aaosphaeria arxii CBS 175.79]KAF2009570.1 hypothetical protein BU24DRAFT_78345 [Aaosphaeria arxii CBS 175.79]
MLYPLFFLSLLQARTPNPGLNVECPSLDNLPGPRVGKSSLALPPHPHLTGDFHTQKKSSSSFYSTTTTKPKPRSIGFGRVFSSSFCFSIKEIHSHGALFFTHKYNKRMTRASVIGDLSRPIVVSCQEAGSEGERCIKYIEGKVERGVGMREDREDGEI